MKKTFLKTILLSCCLCSPCLGLGEENLIDDEGIRQATSSHKQLKLPIGMDDFRESITESDVFVDKTLLIKEIFDNGEKATLITRPRRWGKSMSLSMLHYFFNREVDEDGKALDPQPHRILFEGGNIDLGTDKGGNRTLGKLNIANGTDWETRLKYAQGQYPVIFLSFKDTKGRDLLSVKKFIGQKIYDAYHSHKYLAKSTVLQEDDKKDFEDRLNDYKQLNKPSVEDTLLKKIDLRDSLKFLSELLYNHHHKRAYILIDEYDKPVNYLLEDSAVFSGEMKPIVKEVGELVTAILSECGKTNVYLEKLILTGIFDTLQKEGNSGLNNIKIYGIQSQEYSKSYGFSEEEIKEQLLDKFSFPEGDSSRIMASIKDWYNGYRITGGQQGNMRLYTPWAVVNYLQDVSKDLTRKPENYWGESGANLLLAIVLNNTLSVDLQNTFEALAKGENPQVLEFDKKLSLLDIKPNEYTKTEKMISYLLLNSGYLTAEEKENGYVFRIPNNEVKDVFKKVVRENLQKLDEQNGKKRTQLTTLLDIFSYYTPTWDIIHSIQAQNITSLQGIFLDPKVKIECDYSTLRMSFLHLAALAGNQSIFESLLEHCDSEILSRGDRFNQKGGLRPIDYAELGGHSALVKFMEGKGQKVGLIKAPSWGQHLVCFGLRSPAGDLLGAIIGGSAGLYIKGTWKNYLQNINIRGQQPFRYRGVWPITAAALGWVAEKGIYLLSTPFVSCDEYDQYYTRHKDINDISFNSSSSLRQLEKYKAAHPRAYVTLNNTCNSTDRNVTQVTIYPLSFDAKGISFTLCDQLHESVL